VHFDAGRSWHEHDDPGVPLFATALHLLGKTPIACQFDRHGVPDLPSAPIDIDELRRAARTDRGDLDGDGTDERVRLRP
jgi:hypothetical protein